MSKMDNNFREKMLNSSAYWVENINGLMYDAIVTYMEEHNMNRAKLAAHLGISPGRVSQILNDGETNFSIEKMIEIALKVDKIPNLNFEDKTSYLANACENTNVKTISMVYSNQGSPVNLKQSEKKELQSKVIPLPFLNTKNEPLKLSY